MANNNRCGGCGRRNSNNGYGCLNCLSGRGRWENYPYYNGSCPDADGYYDRDDDRDENRGRRRHRGRRDGSFGLFSAMLPMAVAANGVIPLVNNCMWDDDSFPVNSGLITIEEGGTYLATYTVRVPGGAAVASTFTLNVNDASQSTAITEVGGEGPASFTAQAVFSVCDQATVALRTSEAINITETSTQPLVTMTLVQI